jgi:hypothetical protein
MDEALIRFRQAAEDENRRRPLAVSPADQLTAVPRNVQVMVEFDRAIDAVGGPHHTEREWSAGRAVDQPRQRRRARHPPAAGASAGIHDLHGDDRPRDGSERSAARGAGHQPVHDGQWR